MGLPKEFKNERTLFLENQIKQIDINKLENLTNEDFKIISMYIQTYNFIDLNIRRCFYVLNEKGILEKIKKDSDANIPNLINKIISCLSELDLNSEQKKEVDEKLNEIKYFRNFRNIFAHFAGKRIPNQDAIIFMTNEQKDIKKTLKQTGTSDTVLYSLLDIETIKELVEFSLKYECWLAEFVSMIIKI